MTVIMYTPPLNQRIETPLSGNWKFIRSDVPNAQSTSFDDSAWSTIALPHTWNNLDGQDGGDDYYRGTGWYRIHYTPPAELLGRRFYIQFDAASLVADVFVNGNFAGQHRGGFAAFRFDITSLLIAGQDNVIAVRVNNEANQHIAPLQHDFTICGGLYRMVHIICTDAIHVNMGEDASSGVFLTTPKVSASSAIINICTEIRNDSTETQSITVRSILLDTMGEIVTKVTSTQSVARNADWICYQSTEIPNPHLWYGVKSPYLYQVYTEIHTKAGIMDVVVNPLGIRTFSITATDGFSLNGEYVDLRGVNKHQEKWNKGWAISNADQEHDINLVLEMGCNAIRLAHYQHPQHTYDLCDRSGLVVWSEIPDFGVISTDPEFLENMTQQLTEMIRQNYNHPSVCFWSIGNEMTNGPDPADVLKSLNETAHKLDNTRPTTLAANSDPSHPTNFISDIVTYNRYYGWYYGEFDNFATFLDSTHEKYPEMVMGMGEYGPGASLYVHSDNPVAMDHSEEFQCLYHEKYWSILAERPWVWCKFIWVGMDFGSDGRKEGDTNGRNNKGLISADRRTNKDAFYYLKANWSASPTLHITGRRYNNRPGLTRDIKVYSNASSVNLHVNGISQSERTGVNGIFIWSDVPLTHGDNTVVASASIGGVAYSDTVNWYVPADGQQDGIYTLLNQTTGKTLDITENGFPTLSMLNGTRTQFWILSNNNNGYVSLRNASTGLFLTVNAGSYTPVMADSTVDEAQRWTIAQTDSAYILTDVEGSLCLQATKLDNSNDTVLHLAPPGSDSNQLWHLNPAYQLAGGTYRITNAGDGSLLYCYDGVWEVTMLGNGCYSIIQKDTGNKINTDGNINDQWSIQMTKLGFLIIVPSSGLALETDINNIGTNINLCGVTNETNQIWLFHEST